jgi:para-aminobenzoate synthetase
MLEARPRILYIDAYDSFANNVVALLRLEIDAIVEVIEHDDSRFFNDKDAFRDYLGFFDAVVAGPGPGHPSNAQDVGAIRHLWDLKDPVPVLGVCLGFQRLCLDFGADIRQLHMPRHGVINHITLGKADMFENLDDFNVTSYHSLHADLKYEPLSSVSSQAHWTSSSSCPDLEPLAWDLTDIKNGPVLMAARHRTSPFWGVQFHPESICTDPSGKTMIREWWRLASLWMKSHPRVLRTDGIPRPPMSITTQTKKRESQVLAASDFGDLLASKKLSLNHRVQWKKLSQHIPDVPDLCEYLDAHNDESMIFQSGRLPNGQPINPNLGRFSVIGIVSKDVGNIRVQYDVNTQVVRLFEGSASSSGSFNRERKVSDIWAYLREFVMSTKCHQGPTESPFWGGLMGYISYEAGLESISVKPPATMQTQKQGSNMRPDINFVFIVRSIVIDHIEGVVWVQSVFSDDDEWVQGQISKLQSFELKQTHSNGSRNGIHATLNGHAREPGYSPLTHHTHTNGNAKGTSRPPHVSSFDRPSREAYIKKINQCDSFIRQGDSYELCLTAQTTVRPSSPQSGWSLFRQLSQRNPAPFSSYLRLKSSGDAVTIISSSPERFLSWSRDGYCQFRPIKGTVKKTPLCGRKEAVEILSSSKERAENLMIADLIRHDLHGIVGAGNVKVEKLMQIEEYATVFQLVSVIEGNLNGPKSDTSSGKNRKVEGFDVLSASLPPGSMTGAPKKRSCEILAEIEERKPRGIYSGVIGYLDVGGGGDFSVVIRTAYRWDSGGSNAESNGVNGHHGLQNGNSNDCNGAWTIGAGGAITAQSDPESEYQEMLTKLSSVLPAFGITID